MLSLFSTRFVFSSKISAGAVCRKAFSSVPEKVASLETANQKKITQHNIQEAIKKFQIHKSDTGSPSAQIAAATEKIYSLSKHFAVHKKDKASQRGYQVLIAKRRSMLQYLRRKNVNEYNHIVQELGLKGQVKEI